MKIIDNVYVVPGINAHAYLIVDPDGITVIDAGLPRSEKKILAYVESLGKSAGDIKRILLTHSDVDHIGGLAALVKATGARTYASKIEAEATALGKPSRPIKPSGSVMRHAMFTLLGPLMKATPIQVDEILTDGQVLPILGGLRVVDTTGHTPGHISLFAPAASILFCGDAMVVDDKGIHSSRPALTWDEAKAQASTKKQAGLGAKIVCSGHGPIVMDAVGKYHA